MDARANVQIIDEEYNVFLYTHDTGTELLSIVQSAMKRASIVQSTMRRGYNRLDDAQYLARIIFCEMVMDDVMGLEGYGISARVWDGGDRIITVDPGIAEVRIGDRTWTFSEFLNLASPGW